MKFLKFALLILAISFIAIQFFRPEKSPAAADLSADISTAVTVPEGVTAILRESCYDCHSNETRYPWYFEIQPVGWWLNDHIDDARGHLNFSDFASTSLRRQYHKLEEITEQIDLGEMPLPSYLIVHRGAELSEDQKDDAPQLGGRIEGLDEGPLSHRQPGAPQELNTTHPEGRNPT